MRRIITYMSFIVILAIIVLGIYNNLSNQIVRLEDFKDSVVNGDPTVIVGIYQEGVFAAKVIQQPEGDVLFLPDSEDTIVLLSDAKKWYGNVGLSAHRNLAGRYIAELELGNIVQVIYGDGTMMDYEIVEVRSYQAISPDDLYSDFRDLDNNQLYSSTELFEKAFGGENRIGLITCISKDDINSWGRIVVNGVPIN
ncbi:MAG: hypothetical protein JEZ00_21300 [Anaerolineaceae bacterium]|nr:hypothetical protein [Anaerolineaceae bacterium]